MQTYGHSEETYEAAFELWAFVLDGSARAVSQRLTDNGTPVPARTVQYWARQHDWAGRKLAQLAQDVPGLHRLNLAHLAYGSAEGFRLLRSVARGDARDISPAIIRNEINASIALIDRAGYAPRHVSASGQHRPNIPDVAQDLELGDEDVAALILGDYGVLPATIDQGDSTGGDG